MANLQLLSILSRWFNRKPALHRSGRRPMRPLQELIIPTLEGLEERTVPAVTFSYNDLGTSGSVVGNLTFDSQSPDEFTLTSDGTSTDYTFRSDAAKGYGNSATLVVNPSAIPVQTKAPPATVEVTTFLESVKLLPNLAAGSILNLDRDTPLASLTGAGTVQPWASTSAGRAITLGVPSATTATFSGVLQDNTKVLSLIVNQSGTEILTGTNTYTGTTKIQAGTLRVNGSLAVASAVTVPGGTLSGTGTVGAVTVTASGTLAPGAAVGTLNTGAVSLDSTSNFSAGINSAAAYSKDKVTGTVNLGSSTLNIALGYNPTYGTAFTLVENDGTDAVTGTFNGLAEGAKIDIGVTKLQISYIGGDGNDVVLTTISKWDTTTVVTSSNSPSIYGSTVTFTATVSPAPGTSAIVPTGTVTFFAGATNLGTATMASGAATWALSTLYVGAYSITAAYNGDAKYNTSLSGAITQTVTPAALTITAAANTKTYDATITAAALPTVAGLQNSDTVTGLSETYDNANAGTGKTLTVATYTVNDGNGGANYTVTTVTSTAGIINKANATIAVTPYSVTYDATAHTATGTVSGVGPVNQSDLDLTGTTHTNAGTYTDTWVFTDTTGNYNNSTGTVVDTIAKANATIVVTPYSVTYDATAHTATGTVSGVGPVNQSDLDLTGTTHTNAGTYTDTWVFTDTTGNYNDSTGTVVDTIAKANATIVVTPYSVTYDATAHTATGTVSGVGPVNQSDLDLTGTTHTNAGTYTDTWVFTDTTGNYNDSTGTVVDTISKANATIAVTPYSVTYDTLAHTATGTVSGAGPVNQSDLDLTGTTHTNAGTYTDTWVFTDTTGNYNNSTGTVVDTIAKANATIIVTPYSVTYDATAHTATGIVSGVGPVNQSDLELTGTTHTNAGTYTDTWVFTDTTGNYNNSTGTVDNSIAKAGLTITAVANTKTYDGSTSATATPTVGTMQGTDTVTGLTQAYDTANAGTGKNLSVASYTVNDGNGGFNYTVTLVDSIAGVVNQLTTATVRYTGDVFVTTTNTGSTNVPLAAQLSGGGDYTTATVKFYNAFTNILLATATPDANGIAATTFVCSSPGVGTSYLVRTVLSGANYSNIDQVFPTETWTASNMNAYAQVNVFTSTGMAGWLQGAGQYIDTTATGTLKPIEGVPISYGIAAPVAMAGSGSTTGMINIIIPTASGIYMVKAGTLSAITDSSTSRIVTSTSATLFKIGVNPSRDGNSISAPATSVTVVATIGKGATDEAQFSVYKGSTSYWNDNGLVTILNDLTDINGRKGKNRIIGS